MVQINEQEGLITISFKGDAEDYWNYIRALTRLIACQNSELYDAECNYFATTLLESLLPSAEEVVKIN